MDNKRDNIILIGMPGAGKSTVGVVLAKNLGYDFLDSDLVIQKEMGDRLEEIIREKGLQGFLEIENRVNAGLDPDHTIIATGGSAVFGQEAMEHLGRIGTVVYLKLSYETIEDRLGSLTERGVVHTKGQTLRDIYEERVPLYEKYADVTIDCENQVIRDIVSEIRNAVSVSE